MTLNKQTPCSWSTAATVLGTILALSACGNDGGKGSSLEPPPVAGPPPSTPPPDPPDPVPGGETPSGGYFVGSVTKPDGQSYGEALVTTDGHVRIFAQGLEFAQITGNVLEQSASLASGTGSIIGEHCAGLAGGGFCGGSVPVQIDLTSFANKQLIGAIRIPTQQRVLTWTLDMRWYSDTYSTERATMEFASGTYREVMAEFAAAGDVVTAVDAGGEIFFQSASSGCVGHGRLAAHGDGELNVYDVVLQIANCDVAHALYNRRFTGLATVAITKGYGWDYKVRIPGAQASDVAIAPGNEVWLVLWVTTPDGELPAVALTMWGVRWT